MNIINTDTILLSSYVRLVSYSLVVLSSITLIRRPTVSKVLLLGDILVALALLIFTIYARILRLGTHEEYSIYYLTPAVIVWAAIHFIALMHKQ